ncbi:MAG: c-type cytochrome domain-containing protein [Anaerolineales bacterium]
MKKFREKLRNFFFPPAGSPRWLFVLPYAILGVVTISLLVGGAYVWDYTNSPPFCGETCHTMPPEYAAYQLSPHSRVACVECHIGREFIGNQIFRKAGDVRHVIAVTFNTYEYPIRAKGMRPAPEICEKCHSPEKFSDDSLRVKEHFSPDTENTPYSVYLVLKTGGGSKRVGLGRGIHWHIENDVKFLSTDKLDQNIPYIRVLNEDGSVDEYVDVESGFNKASVNEEDLKTMDCITCHNRISHTIPYPDQSVDNALARGIIDDDIPDIRRMGAEVLSLDYTTQEQALDSIADLEAYYETNYPDFYTANQQKVATAIAELQNIYVISVFEEQEVDWDTHPNNVGHTKDPGCFRCHDGKHLNDKDEAIRLECNLCHSIPVVAGMEDFVADIEISRGPEPESHLNPNWIALHREVFDPSCEGCHTTGDPGGTSNTSFCSNSACHGSVYTYAGFDAPALREILQEQLPPPPAEPEPADMENPTYDSYVGPLFTAKCGACHGGSTAQKGLDLSSYAGVMAGGDSGPAIVAGDSAASHLVEVQSGQHFATFSSEELDIIKKWIEAGAPEN